MNGNLNKAELTNDERARCKHLTQGRYKYSGYLLFSPWVKVLISGSIIEIFSMNRGDLNINVEIFNIKKLALLNIIQ